MNMDNLIGLSVKHNASDLHLCVNQVPVLRVDGQLFSQTHCAVVTEDALHCWVKSILDEANYHRLMTKGQADLALFIRDQPLRANIFQAGGHLNAALRLISPSIPTLEDISAPPVFSDLITKTNNGLILVTGATGSGKSSTLAALINHLNLHCRRHIITLEDPVEFRHTGRQSLIRQREIGRDCADYQQALNAALRQDPDVILLGELRDETTIRLALTAAETGHLVLSTLHTRGAIAAIERLTDVFSGTEKARVCSQLAGSLVAVLSQHLIAKQGGGRCALFDVLINTPAVASLIRDDKSYQIATHQQTGAQLGMMTEEQCRQWRQSRGEVPGATDSIPAWSAG